ncbi:Non-specific lipid-transfer protein-like protein [Drosera capensis]
MLAIISVLCATTTGQVACPTVISELTPCANFVTKLSPNPSPRCCDGVRDIVAMVKSQADRQAVCSCAKSVLSTLPNYDLNQIPKLGTTCGLSITLPPIYPNTDCSKVVMEALSLRDEREQ